MEITPAETSRKAANLSQPGDLEGNVAHSAGDILLEPIVDVLWSGLKKVKRVSDEGLILEAKARFLDDLVEYTQTYRYLSGLKSVSKEELNDFFGLFLHLCSFPSFPKHEFLKTTHNLYEAYGEELDWASDYFSFVRMLADKEISEDLVTEAFKTMRQIAEGCAWPAEIWKDFFATFRLLFTTKFEESLAIEAFRAMRSLGSESEDASAALQEFEKELVASTLHTVRVMRREASWPISIWRDFFKTLSFLFVSKIMPIFEFLKAGRQLAQAVRGDDFWKEFFQATRHLVQFDLAEQMGTEFVRTVKSYPDEISFDFLSYGQIESKRVLLEELLVILPDLSNKLVVLLGGWYGLFAQLLFQGKPEATGRVLSVDIDERANLIAEKLNNRLVADGWKFKTITSDVHDIYYDESLFFLKRSDGATEEICERPEVYINTSCEHIRNFGAWRDQIPEGTILALQSNNAFQFEGHVNCVENIEQFKKQARLSAIFCERVIKFKGYERFILIGKT